MRLKSVVSNESAIDIREFADWILKIEDVNMNLNQSGEANISIPTNLLIQESETPLLSLVKFVYGGLIENIMTHGFFDDNATLCPTIDSVEQVNDFILSLIPGEEQIYLSSDTLMSAYFCPHSVFNSRYLIEFMCLKSDLIDNSNN